MKLALLGAIVLLPFLSLSVQAAPAPRLEDGNYASQGSMFARSYRIVASQGSRTCLQTVDGPPKPYAGYESIEITSLSPKNGTYVLDSDNESLTINSPTEFFKINGRSGVWHKIKLDRAPLAAMYDCLGSSKKYRYSTQGSYHAGQILNQTEAKLIDKNANEKINVRKAPGTDAKILHYGRVGDRVTLSLGNTDKFGDVWYFVKFRSSGAEGWVHSKLIQRL